MKNNLLSSGSKLAVILSVLALTGCAKYQSWVLNSTPEKASPFNCTLYKDYKHLAECEEEAMYDECSADFYYRKAICAKRGLNVIPTTLDKWDIEADKVEELQVARARLVADLDAGGREAAPEFAAHAQSNFDCWVEQQSEGWQQDDIARCKSGFKTAIAEVELKLMGGELVVAPVKMIFFDLNSSSLHPGSMAAIDAVAALANTMGGKRHILLIGRTDKVGDAKHNVHLSKNRAMAVKKELIRHGVAPHLITIKGAGEAPGPNVDTHNRRVDVLILEYK